jgi:HK97 family phage prohead protease
VTLNPETLRFAAASGLSLKAEAEGRVAGYAATVEDEPDRHLDIIAAGAFAETIADHARRGTMPGCLWCHAPDQVVGRWTSMHEDSRGLFVCGEINLRTAAGRECFEHLRAGDSAGLSVGFAIPAGGQSFLPSGVTRISKIDLVEISFTPTPANRNARVTSIKSVSSKAELIDVLRSAGLAKAAAARVAAGGWQALAGGDSQKAIDLAAAIEKATANLRSL